MGWSSSTGGNQYICHSIRVDIYFKDFQANTSAKDRTFGADAKIALGSPQSRSLTVNPDFSQVESISK